jgi:hypothetical protein
VIIFNDQDQNKLLVFQIGTPSAPQCERWGTRRDETIVPERERKTLLPTQRMGAAWQLRNFRRIPAE